MDAAELLGRGLVPASEMAWRTCWITEVIMPITMNAPMSTPRFALVAVQALPITSDAPHSIGCICGGPC